MNRAKREAAAFYGNGEEPKPVRVNYTRRNREVLDRGKHPATMGRLRPELGTCGDCRFCVATGYASRTYWKCQQHRLGLSRSEASDIRVSWPACELFQPSKAKTT